MVQCLDKLKNVSRLSREFNGNFERIIHPPYMTLFSSTTARDLITCGRCKLSVVCWFCSSLAVNRTLKAAYRRCTWHPIDEPRTPLNHIIANAPNQVDRQVALVSVCLCRWWLQKEEKTMQKKQARIEWVNSIVCSTRTNCSQYLNSQHKKQHNAVMVRGFRLPLQIA